MAERPSNAPATGDAPASVATYVDLLVEAMRHNRRVRLHLERERIRHQQTRHALRVAVQMLRDYDRQLDAARSTTQHLRDELRRYVATRVDPAARPTPEREEERVH